MSHFIPEQLEAEGHDYKDVSQSIIKKIMKDFGEEQILVGHSKVFMKIQAHEFILDAYEKACQAKITAIKGIFFILIIYRDRDCC